MADRLGSAKVATAVLIFFLIAASLYSQSFPDRNAGRSGTIITGRVVESKTKKPLEYAGVQLFPANSDKQVAGAATGPDGTFTLVSAGPGRFRAEFSFMGFNTAVINVVVNPDQPKLDMGTIEMERTIIWVEGVETVGEEPELEFKIDKKVINVSKNYTSAGGTAVDVLENVPSVSVDIEGNVSLRGSTNFTVLIDNRPTMLEPSDALQQIPASTIENIEIITNPSAKYDPDGVAGIVNVITKKKKLHGFNGTANTNLGIGNKYGGDFLLNYRNSALQARFGASYSDQVFDGTSSRQNITTISDTAYHRDTEGETSFRRKFYGLTGGLDLNLSANDVAGAEFEWRGRDMTHASTSEYDEWTVPGDTHYLHFSDDSSTHGGSGFSLNADYNHVFNNKDHKLSARGIYSQNNGDERSTNRLLSPESVITYGRRSTEKGPSRRVRINLDYVMPLRITDKIESGYQVNLNRSENAVENYEYDTTLNDYVLKPEYSHSSDYAHYIHSLFTTYSGEYGNFGYQAGLRGEYSRRDLKLIDPPDQYLIDKWDAFPTAHVSYKLPLEQQAMVSYTRRINRPRNWELEPFLTWWDAYTVRQGNPGLLPEYIDSYELGYQKRAGRNSFSLDAYYRRTKNKIDRITSVYSTNVMLITVDNVGVDRAYGAELMADADIFKWLNLNLTGNAYRYQIEGELDGDHFLQESDNWSVRANATIKMTPRVRVQLTGIYNSPTVTSQGERRGFVMTNGALKLDLLSKVLSATIQVRDIFGTGRFEYTSRSSDFYSHSVGSRQAPVFMLAINYTFNNYRPDRDTPVESGEGTDFEENFQN